MKLFALALTTALTLLRAGQAVAQAATLPTCGLECIEQYTLKSSCSLTNITCICNNVQLDEVITNCVNVNCTVTDQLATEKYSKDACGVKPRDRTRLVSTLAVTFGALGLLAFILRILSRLHVSKGQFHLDDYTLGVVICLEVSFCVLSVLLANHGLGKDIWNLSPDDITHILYYYFWEELIYLAALPLTKISILILYLRIFPRKGFRYSAYGLIAANIAYLITFELISIFQCLPVPGAWRHWDGTYAATCHNINLQGWMSAIFNILLDVFMLILPMPELYRLSLSRKKKVQIMSMFSLGFFVTIVSILRLKTLTQYANTRNMSQDYVDVGYWSSIEVPVGIICACMPAIRALFSRVFPTVFGGTTSGERSGSSGNESGSKPKSVEIKVADWNGAISKQPSGSSKVELLDVHGPGRRVSGIPRGGSVGVTTYIA